MSPRVAILVTDGYVLATRLRPGRGQWAAESSFTLALETPPGLCEEGDLACVAEAILEAVRGADGLDLPADLIVPASWCYICPLDTTAWPSRRFDPAVAAYQLEEYLPLPLEEVTCAFAHRRRGRCWGVAVRTAPVKRLLDSLQVRRVHVAHVRVDVFAALAAPQGPAHGCTGMIVRDSRHVAVALRDGHGELPSAVHSVVRASCSDPSTDECLRHQIELTESVAGTQADTWTVCDLHSNAPAEDGNTHEPQTSGRIAPQRSDSVEPSEPASSTYPRTPVAPVSNRCLTSSGICSGRDAPGELTGADLLLAVVRHTDQPDLRTGVLAAPGRLDAAIRHGRRCAVLLLVLLGTLALDARLQHRRCRQQIDCIRAAQAELFQAVLPDRQTPANPAMRLASERIRLEGLTQGALPQTNIAALMSTRSLAVFDDLRDLIEGLPVDVRIRLMELNIDPQQLSMRGHTADHRDAERIVETINGIPTLTGRPARTSRLKTGGVEFAIRATRSEHGPQPDRTTVIASTQ